MSLFNAIGDGLLESLAVQEPRKPQEAINAVQHFRRADAHGRWLTLAELEQVHKLAGLRQ
jgi:hypothetical protein